MKIALGSDHAGEGYKAIVKKWLLDQAHEVIDEGTFSSDSVDYPDFAEKVCQQVVRQNVERGILICGTGIGMSIAANKHRGNRAALVHDVMTAKMSRAHNDANVLCLGAKVVSEKVLPEILAVWTTEVFEGQRHARRLEKIKQLDLAIIPFEENS